MISLDEIKLYLRINQSQDDAFITDLIDTAKAYVKEQTGVEYTESDLVYNQLVRLVVAHFYNNRSVVSEKAIVNIPFTLEALLIHLRIRGELETTTTITAGVTND